MIDLVKLKLKAGDGGHGRVSFRREKYVPKGGPDGGDGGDGGSLIIRAVDSKATLEHLSHLDEITAANGSEGSKRKRTGAKGEDKIIEVPAGTVVWLLSENEIAKHRRLITGLDRKLKRGEASFETYQLEKEGQHIPKRAQDQLQDPTKGTPLKKLNLSLTDKEEVANLANVGDEVVICQGGFGGNGNDKFKSSSLTTPLIAEYGTRGEQRLVLLELKLLADLGLVGLPNAGKSTFLSRVTKARPKVDSYPFTTLQPHLGVMSLDKVDKTLVVADIPGLIEGASQGTGLGFSFLRHVEACRALLYMLFLEESVIFEEDKSAEDKAEEVWQQYQTLLAELRQYSQDFEVADNLTRRKSFIALNKVDILTEEIISAVKKKFADHGFEIIPISTATGEGIEKLSDELGELVV